MADEDNLDGFRGRDPGPMDAEGALRESLGPQNEHLVELFQLGEEARVFRTTKLGAYLLGEVERELSEQMSVLLACDDLQDRRAQNAHFRARVAREVASMIDQACVAGRQAEAQILESDRGERQ